MVFDSTLGRIGAPSSTDSSARFAEAVWRPPDSAAERNVELAAMTKPAVAASSDQSLKPMEVSDSSTDMKPPTMDDILSQARDSVGRRDLGNKSPKEARELPNFSVAPNVKCAATVSAWLIGAGVMKNEDFKIRVTDDKGQGLSELLPELGFQPRTIDGKLDPKAFPDGPVGIIAGTEKYKDGTNHVGFVEKRDGQLRVMHNRSGRVADDPLIGSYFYGDNGTPKFNKMKLFVLGNGSRS